MITIKKYVFPLALILTTNVAMADKIGWYYNPQAIIGPFISPDALCSSLGGGILDFDSVGLISWGATSSGRCDNPGGTGFFKLGDECDQGDEFDSKSQSCKPSENKEPSLCPSGALDITGKCDPEVDPEPDCNNKDMAGNPIIIATGQKVEIINDITLIDSSLTFTRNYWSSRLVKNDLGIGWQHNWQMRIQLLKDKDRIKLHKNNGRSIIYTQVDGKWESYSKDRDVLVKLANNQGWKVYTVLGEVETYNDVGQLISYSKTGYPTITFIYNAKGLLTVLTENKTGKNLTLTYNRDGLITKVASGSTLSVSYSYDTKNRLISSTQNAKSKTYHYENSQYPNLLTGITNEAGIRFATWAYNNKGQAISSEHANGADRYSFEYLGYNKTRVTNPLGKSATFYFNDIRLTKKLTSIEGEAINSCIATNVSYRYNSNGQLLSETNANDFSTYYQYNDRGLEVSHRYPFLKEITTKWHDFFSLPVEVNSVGRKQTFKYDDQGRLLESTVGYIDKSDTKQGQDSAVLLFTDFTDVTGNIWKKVNNPQITQDNEAINGRSLYLDGNSYLTTDNNAGYFDFGRDDFTIEMWIKPESAGSLFDAMYRHGEIASYSFSILPEGSLFWQSYDNVEKNSSSLGDNSNIIDGKWHHIAVSRERNLLRLFMDGRLTNWNKNYSNYLLNKDIDISIGARLNEPENFPSSLYKGYIDQLRVTKKSLYSEDFTPSRTPYVLNKYSVN